MAFDPGGFSSEFGPGTTPPQPPIGDGSTTGTGAVVLQTSPTIITPNIGDAAGRSFAATGYAVLPNVTYSYANGTQAAPTPVTGGGWVGYNAYQGWDGSAFAYLGDFAVEAVGPVSPGNVGGEFVFRTRPTGAGAVPAVAMTLNPDQSATHYGNVNLVSGKTYQINGVPLAASNLSNGVTGSGAVVLASGATLNPVGVHVGTLTRTPNNLLSAYGNTANFSIEAIGDGVASNFNASMFFNAAQGPIFQGIKARGTLAAPTAVVSGDVAAIFQGTVWDGSAYVQIANVAAQVQTFAGALNVSGELVFSTRTAGAAGALATALTLDQNQNASFVGSVQANLGLIINPPGATQFDLVQRQVALGNPNATFYPATPATQMVVSLMPNGASAASVPAGINIYDSDVFASSAPAVNYLQLAMMADAARITAGIGGGATQKPFAIRVGTTDALTLSAAGVETLAQLPVWPAIGQNRFWAGPASGGSGVPAGRKLVTADMPFAAAPFTPTVTFTTPGDVAVTYTQQVGFYFSFGPSGPVYINILLQFTLTWATASGALRIGGLPIIPTQNNSYMSAFTSGGITFPSGCTFILGQALTDGRLGITAYGSGATQTALQVANVPSGANVYWVGISGLYY